LRLTFTRDRIAPRPKSGKEEDGSVMTARGGKESWPFSREERVPGNGSIGGGFDLIPAMIPKAPEVPPPLGILWEKKVRGVRRSAMQRMRKKAASLPWKRRMALFQPFSKGGSPTKHQSCFM